LPIHDLGYRPWNGELKSMFSKFLVIASSGISLAGKSRWMRRILMIAWIPVLYWGAAFFFVGRTFEQPKSAQVGKIESLKQEVQLRFKRKAAQTSIERMFRRTPLDISLVLNSIEQTESNEQARNRLWSWLLMTFFRYSQAILILVLVGSIAPALISRDLRSRAYLLYFSRPIGKLEYIMGKIAVPATYIVLVSTLPALVLYVFGVMMSPDISVVYSTWDVPIRILLATVVLVVPTATFALMLSSLTSESRFASFAWFASWILGHGAWQTVVVATAMRMNTATVDPDVMNSPAVKNWSHLSIYNNLGEVQTWVFGFKEFGEIIPAATILLAMTLISLIILYFRVKAPLRA